MKKPFNLVRLLYTTLFLLTPITKIVSKPTIIFIINTISFKEISTELLNYEEYDIYFIVDINTEQLYNEFLSGKAKGMVTVNNINNYNLVKNTIEKLNINKIDYIIPSPDEKIIMLASKLRKVFNVDNGIREETAKLFVNKLTMKEALRKYNIAQVPFIENIEMAENFFLSFPIVAKPKEESGSRGIKIIKNKKELRDAIREINSNGGKTTYIAEEYIEGDDYMINCVISDGDIRFSLALKFIGKKIDFYQKGEARGVITVDEGEKKKLEIIAKKIIKNFKLKNGGFFIDFIKDKKTGKFLVSEVACRIGGGGSYNYLTEKNYGISMCFEALKAELGIPLELSIKKDSNSKVLGAVSITYPRNSKIYNCLINKKKDTKLYCCINEISNESFGDNFQTFSSYMFREKNTLPKEGEYLNCRECVYILLESSDRETLLREINEIKENFVLSFETNKIFYAHEGVSVYEIILYEVNSVDYISIPIIFLDQE